MRLPGTPDARRALAVALAGGWLLVAGAACTDDTPAVTYGRGQDAASAAAATTPEPAATHVVERGETLAGIARDAGIDVAELARLNEIEDPDRIEVGQVLLLEPEPTLAPVAARSRAAEEEEEPDPVVAWLRARWEDVPRPDLSDRALEHGAIAGLMLPAAVLTFVVLWLFAVGVRRATVATAHGVGRALPRRPGTGDGPGAPGSGPGTSGGDPGDAGSSGAPGGAASVGGGSAMATAGEGDAAAGAPADEATAREPSGRGGIGRACAAAGGAVRRGVLASASFVAALIAVLPRRAARTASEGGRRWGEQRAVQRRLEALSRERVAAREQWWRSGTEALRIGLLDEAERCFRQGLELARAQGWDEEVALYDDGLAQVSARRGAPRPEPSSDASSSAPGSPAPAGDAPEA